MLRVDSASTDEDHPRQNTVQTKKRLSINTTTPLVIDPLEPLQSIIARLSALLDTACFSLRPASTDGQHHPTTSAALPNEAIDHYWQAWLHYRRHPLWTHPSVVIERDAYLMHHVVSVCHCLHHIYLASFNSNGRAKSESLFEFIKGMLAIGSDSVPTKMLASSSRRRLVDIVGMLVEDTRSIKETCMRAVAAEAVTKLAANRLGRQFAIDLLAKADMLGVTQDERDAISKRLSVIEEDTPTLLRQLKSILSMSLGSRLARRMFVGFVFALVGLVVGLRARRLLA